MKETRRKRLHDIYIKFQTGKMKLYFLGMLIWQNYKNKEMITTKSG